MIKLKSIKITHCFPAQFLFAALFQGRPQFVTVGSSLSDTSKPLRPSQSEPSLDLMMPDEVPSSSLPPNAEASGQLETLSHSDNAQGTANEYTDMTPEKASIEEAKSNQGDKGSESSDEVHGFEKLEKEEDEAIDDTIEVTSEDENRSTRERSKRELESLGASNTSELRYRPGHGQEET